MALGWISRSAAREIPLSDTVQVEEVPGRGIEASTTQNQKEISEDDTLSGSGSRNRLEIAFDYLKLVSLASSEEMKLEGGLGYISKINVGINIEFGYGEKTPEDFYKNAEYKVSGYYGRVGMSYYYPYNPGVNFIIGAKYAMAQYEDEATFSVLSSLWDDLNGSFNRKELEASWAELILGSESSVSGNLYFGFTFRMRFLIQADNFDPFEVYSIPGFGRSFDTIVPTLNLYVKFFIPFGKSRQ
jgi:hypothetical protein